MTNKLFTEVDKRIFMKAMEEYFTKGTSATKCNVCSNLIIFRKVNDAVVHSCECGKFNGSLRK